MLNTLYSLHKYAEFILNLHKYNDTNNIVNKYIIFVFIILSLFSFAILKYFSIAHTNIVSIYTLLAIILLANFLSFDFKYQSTSNAFKILSIGLSTLSAIYILTSYPTYIEYNSNNLDYHSQYLSYARWLALFSSVLALTRPTFIIFPMLYIFQSKYLAHMFTGFPITGTDYLPVIEIGMFLGICSLIYSLILKYSKINVSIRNFNYKNIQYFDIVIILCVAIHFGNYFYSGLYKLLLDGGMTSWIQTNKTYYLLLNAHSSGHLPISHYQNLFKFVYEACRDNYILSNAFIITTQLISLVILYRIRWACALIILYDLIHLVIFLTTGIFFWKWIILNVLLVISLTKLNIKILPTSVFTMAIICILTAKTLFFTAKLAWYDTPALNDAHIVAITHDGSEHRVPSNYFLDSSVTYAQQRVGLPFTGQFATKTFGTTSKNRIKIMSESCGKSNISNIDQAINLEILNEHVSKHHNYILQHLDNNGLLNYDYYPHHIWSNPYEYKSFKELDKRLIQSYIFKINSVCNYYNDGKVVSKLAKSSEYKIKLQ